MRRTRATPAAFGLLDEALTATRNPWVSNTIVIAIDET
jgi:hypothetical protein